MEFACHITVRTGIIKDLSFIVFFQIKRIIKICFDGNRNRRKKGVNQ